MEKFNGQIPMIFGGRIDTIAGCWKIKTSANVITQSVIDRQPNMAVDTHVFRVSKRIGLEATVGLDSLCGRN